MKIIYITCKGQDNLEDSVFHGMRSLFGSDCVDYPKKERMYQNFERDPNDPMYGRLFTLWRTLDDIQVDRENIEERIIANDYDLIVFGSIHRSYEMFKKLKPYLKKNKTILLDGEDHNRFRFGTHGFLYFKRELTPKIWYYYSYKLFPPFIYSRLSPPKNIKPTAFSIPKEKITYGIARHTKENLFPMHIVDEEVRRSELAHSRANFDHPFDEEKEYYADLQKAKFGITTKRGGWDCFRHYEIAANGAVMCFRDLPSKPTLCAPHGIDTTNAIIYNSVNDLKAQIDTLSDSNYDLLLEQSYKWIERQTTEFRVKEILETANAYFKNN